MSTDADILAIPLAPGWPAATARYNWAQVQAGGQGLDHTAVIVVIAHGNATHIGNADDTLDIDPSWFLVLIQETMQAGQYPAAVYISTCGTGLAEFAAGVRLLAEQNAVWNGTRIYGHDSPIAGAVPLPGSLSWVQIF
ncbi:hypothetical protein [Xanthomonas theicola]|nr:hypothetical protein [Xanthomonas theicola]